MDNDEFRKYAHMLVDWMADYAENLRDYPVKAQVEPGEIIKRVPEHPPQDGEPFQTIFDDFQKDILPGVTHWQHPRFMAYFPANSSGPSVLGEMLTSAMGAQCMIWQTSPAAAELEERLMQWLAEMIDLPGRWDGVIQDTASTATLCSILTAREKMTDFGVNSRGLAEAPKFTVYCSTETHSSIEKSVKIAGLGKENLRKVPVDSAFAMKAEDLEKAISDDLTAGFTPLCVIGTIGTTGSTALDPLRAIGETCQKYKIWFHVDAAFAGTGLLLPEMRYMADGLELADTFVFNPHKWMFTNFDCSAYYVRDKEALIRTFEILPEYLKTAEGDRVNNYRDWGIALGRRFRALKLWFVIRSFGVKGLQERLRYQIGLAQDLVKKMESHERFELLAPTPLNVICFHYRPEGVESVDEVNRINEQLLETINATGKMYMTHTKLNGVYTLRLVIGQTNVTESDVVLAWNLLQKTAADSI